VLINFYGVRILTDPAFSARVGIGLGIGTLGPKRFVAPALRFDELPPVDLVLLSHAHMDHMDLPTLARFKSTQAVITAKDTTEILKPTKLQPLAELNWGEPTTLKTSRGELRVEAFEVKHWGNRWPGDKDRGYNGYVLRREGRALLFGGDTAMTPLFRNLRSGGPYAAAIMPVGAYDPWIHAHCTPEEALQMADDAGAQLIAPIHHSTFKLSDEPMTEPLERIEQALAQERDRLLIKQIGDTAVLA
jgi:L-ascorbate metabolism protein UlaG (beta-lactamase superfamily)